MFFQLISFAFLLAFCHAGLLLDENYGASGLGYGGIGLGSKGVVIGHGGNGIRIEGIGGGYGGEISLSGRSGVALGGKVIVDYWAPPQYEYKYVVQDPHTGDFKEKEESRIGDLTKTKWGWVEKDRQVQVARVIANNAPLQRIGKY